MAQLFFTMAAAFAEMEKSYIIDRLSSGRAQAIQSGKKMGRSFGSFMTDERRQEKYKKEIMLLKKGVPMIEIAQLTGTSLRTVQRLKKTMGI